MVARFHFNPETGNTGECSARDGHCPFGGDAPHWPTKAEARSAYEESMGGERRHEPVRLIDILPATEAKVEEQDPTITYDFSIYKLGKAIDSIDKANRRAERAGIPERFTYDVEKYTKTEQDSMGFDVIEERARFTLNRPEVKHDGWTFAGTMAWDPEAGLVTRMAPGQGLLEKPKEKLCDVCGKERTRNDTYIVQKDGEQKQVGSNCLKRFMGIRPAGLWMLEYDLDDVQQDTDDSGSFGGGALGAATRRDSAQMLALAQAVVEKHGWVSRGAAQFGGKTATADRVQDIINNTPSRDAGVKREREAFRARAKELADAGEGSRLLNVARDIEGDGDYVENMKTVASVDTVDSRNMPLLLSVIASEQKKKEREVAKKAAAQSEYVGTKGEKLEPREVTVVGVKPYSNSYGYGESTSHIVTLRDQDGNVYKSFYSGKETLAEGEQVTLKAATVKDHKEWQGAKETMVTRMKFERPAPAPKVAPATKLPKGSPYAAATDSESNHEIFRSRFVPIRERYQAEARENGGWEHFRNRPADPALAARFLAEKEAENAAFEAREAELS